MIKFQYLTIWNKIDFYLFVWLNVVFLLMEIESNITK